MEAPGMNRPRVSLRGILDVVVGALIVGAGFVLGLLLFGPPK